MYVCVFVCVLLWDVQSVNKGTSNGTLSMFSRCGLTFSIPFGSLAWKNKNQVISIYVKVCVCEWFVYQFGILPPGRNKENSFLEGVKNAFVEILSVNTV